MEGKKLKKWRQEDGVSERIEFAGDWCWKKNRKYKNLGVKASWREDESRDVSLERRESMRNLKKQ